MSTSDIHLSLAQNRLIVTHGPSLRTVQLQTIPALIAKLMRIFAIIFPCICKGVSTININNHIHYVAQSHLKKSLQCQQEHPCNLQDPSQNALALKTLAVSYFSSPLKTLPLSYFSKGLPRNSL